MLWPTRLAVLPLAAEMNCRIFFVVSVFPAPDSPWRGSERDEKRSYGGVNAVHAQRIPDISTDWLLASSFILKNAVAAMAKTWGE